MGALASLSLCPRDVGWLARVDGARGRRLGDGCCVDDHRSCIVEWLLIGIEGNHPFALKLVKTADL